jgi:hypothetical protein
MGTLSILAALFNRQLSLLDQKYEIEEVERVKCEPSSDVPASGVIEVEKVSLAMAKLELVSSNPRYMWEWTAAVVAALIPSYCMLVAIGRIWGYEI